MPNKPKCPICNDTYWIYEYGEEEVFARKCSCLEKILLRNYLGTEIYSAKKVVSDFYHPTENKDTGETEGDITRENLFIKGTWEVTCGHLRWILVDKFRRSLGFTYKIVDDNRLVRVWLGMEAYMNRSTKVRNDIETNNSLLDLLSFPDLSIIRLGFIIKNAATPKVLYEALKVREGACKPTWIVEGTKAFLPGHCAYNDNVYEYIQSKFRTIDLGGDIETERKTIEAIAEEVEDFGIAMGPDVEAPKSSELEGGTSYDMPESPKRYRPNKWRKGGSGGMSDLDY